MSHSPHILVVEDDDDISEYILRIIQELDANAQITVVTNRDEARQLLEDKNFYDLLSLDLTIPAFSGSSEKKIEYGNEILHYCNDVAPGLPILILTASSTDDLVSDFLESSEKTDIWGEGQKRSTVGHALKRRLDDYESKIKDIVQAIRNLHQVEVNKTSDGIAIPLQDDRLIRIFARRNNGTRCDISIISGGLSGARVYRICVYNNSGNVIHNVVAKIADHTTISTEDENYAAYISRLRPEITPRRIETTVFGAKDTAAVFYGLAVGHDTDFFGVATGDTIETNLSKNIRDLTDKWLEASTEESKTIKDVRCLLLNNECAEALIKEYDLDWATGFEDQPLQAKWCYIHGDLNGKNILVNREQSTATLIDYGDIKEGPATIDPVTLEFSLFFHPDAASISNWPSIEQARKWFDLEEYIKDCPIPQVIKFVREWTRSVEAGRRERAASAYSYLLRQLKYTDTDKGLAIALLEGTRNLYATT
ncbi:MAG: response regulator [Nitrospirales bacterium]|nr:response regulator [Nitrospira sp.]MDR4499840.1 response regulator [Nitrospirales bacterium]